MRPPPPPDPEREAEGAELAGGSKSCGEGGAAPGAAAVRGRERSCSVGAASGGR